MNDQSTAPSYPVDALNQVKRRHDRGFYDHVTVHALLDAAMLCHVSYVIDGQPFCTPTFFWREGSRLHWHGSSASRMKFEQPVQQNVFQEYVDTVKAISRRVDALDKQIESAAAESVFWPVIEGLMALRGVKLLTAMTIVAEIGDLKRFASAPQLMAYLGVVPSEHSSGGTKSRGGITKTGNGHVRRVLVEAAWTYRHPARKTTVLQRRARRAPEVVQEIAWKAQKRMCGRYRLLEARGKLRVQVTTAIARELTGFIWVIGQALPPPVANA